MKNNDCHWQFVSQSTSQIKFVLSFNCSIKFYHDQPSLQLRTSTHMFLAVTRTDPASTVELSLRVLSGSKLLCGPDDNCDLLNNLIIHGNGLVPIHNCGGEVRTKRNRRKQKHGSRTTTHKKNCVLPKKNNR